ncbi:hypothetical protein [Promicromonospora iranensis]|uniref:WYL domain-containing protein n=1 Tax=Promicromonospora iranensis TaxID=1105144 RepID=A0ABU2CWF7_9MICO|nr:hypothetical protein [Promicromonospora iranensis]MDR7385688.1 hypothetical protein [Promicromonospora iranensis]
MYTASAAVALALGLAACTAPKPTAEASGWTWNGEPFAWTQIDAWVSMLSVVLTLFALGFAVCTAYRSEQRAREAREEADQANEKMEAALISLEVDLDHGFFAVTNNSGRPIRLVRVYAVSTNQNQPSYKTTVRRLLSPGGRVELVPDDGQSQPDLLDHHAVMFQNHFDRWWASFAGGELLRLPEDEEAAEGEVVERLKATMWNYLRRTSEQATDRDA